MAVTHATVRRLVNYLLEQQDDHKDMKVTDDGVAVLTKEAATCIEAFKALSDDRDVISEFTLWCKAQPDDWMTTLHDAMRLAPAVQPPKTA